MLKQVEIKSLLLMDERRLPSGMESLVSLEKRVAARTAQHPLEITAKSHAAKDKMDHSDIFLTVRIFPLSKEARLAVEQHGAVMRLVETSKDGPFKDWDDQVLLNPLQGMSAYWFRNGIDMEYELT